MRDRQVSDARNSPYVSYAGGGRSVNKNTYSLRKEINNRAIDLTASVLN